VLSVEQLIELRQRYAKLGLKTVFGRLTGKRWRGANWIGEATPHSVHIQVLVQAWKQLEGEMISAQVFQRQQPKYGRAPRHDLE
jgi:hypothetical protein